MKTRLGAELEENFKQQIVYQYRETLRSAPSVKHFQLIKKNNITLYRKVYGLSSLASLFHTASTDTPLFQTIIDLSFRSGIVIVQKWDSPIDIRAYSFRCHPQGSHFKTLLPLNCFIMNSPWQKLHGPRRFLTLSNVVFDGAINYVICENGVDFMALLNYFRLMK